jgi:hypothetical protein
MRLESCKRRHLIRVLCFLDIELSYRGNSCLNTLYIVKTHISEKRNLVESTAPKVPELLRSTHKEYRSREKKLEKYLKMLPEEREIHDKREEAICFAKCALVNALRNTVQIFLDKEENEKKEDKEKNKKYLQLAMKYLPSSGV